METSGWWGWGEGRGARGRVYCFSNVGRGAPRVDGEWMWNLWIIKEETEDGVFLVSDRRLLGPSPEAILSLFCP